MLLIIIQQYNRELMLAHLLPYNYVTSVSYCSKKQSFSFHYYFTIFTLFFTTGIITDKFRSFFTFHPPPGR